MADQDAIFKKISEALLVDYSSVYYVNAVTNEYYWYSANPEFHSLSLEPAGEDFFKNLVRDCQKVIYEEDLHIFLEDMKKENLLSAVKKGSMKSIEYRLMINGVPTWHALRMIRGLDEDSDYFILGVINIDKEYRHKLQEEETARQKEVYNHVASSLAGHYDTIYYVDIETSTYIEISSTDEYKKLNVPATGRDFFAESRRSIRKYVHPEDQENVIKIHYKDAMLNNLKYRNAFSVVYRLVVNDEVRHIRHSEIMASDHKHIIVCIENIDEEVKADLELKETKKKSLTYTQIAESLASHYDLIYYVDINSEYYVEYSTHKIYGELEIQEEGGDFFKTAEKNANKIIHKEDRERIKLFLDKDNIISKLEDNRQLVEDYRMVIGGGEPQFTRMMISWSSDKTHLIICIENREEYVKKEQEHIKALNLANDMARRDSLTSTRNKTAYHEFEQDLQKQIDEGAAEPFGILVCDLNELKLINDTQGHKAGDDYIKNACKLICRTFAHCPVFRVGGDEFVVVMRGQDYVEKDNLISLFSRKIEENIRIGQGPIIASGLAVFNSEDKTVEDVFKRADGRMYQEKARLKEMRLLLDSYSMKEHASVKVISDDRRKLLDTLYQSYEVVSDGSYVYLCDMKYDFSRWSKSAVDAYELPSEYMYGAGDIWENYIHPDDREAYHNGLGEIFKGNTSGHDMQYRVRRPDGEYDVCTCRGVVIRDLFGEPDYFVGTIRIHGSHDHIDALTGLRNQYGFFEDLNSCIKRQAAVNVLVVGISKFSEINEVYGYHFGNRVLQLYSRKIYDDTRNLGTCYRIDGTKFAIISHELTVDEIKDGYKEFRNYFRERFYVGDKKIMLEVNCGALQIDSFELDSQTVYACLNFAYDESKTRRQGDLVLFQNNLTKNNRQRLEKLHAIRASIMNGYKGFYLMYQPVVDAHTEELIGGEALLRWKNDKYGMVPPDQFVPILESDPLFPDLGEWIIKEALASAKEIIKRRPNFIISINLSYTQLEKPDFADMVSRIVDDIGFPPDHICFEITERCRLLDIELLKNVAVRLKSKGMLIALDDFGTGFSSVGIVRELPFDIIKIDRGFVKRIEEDEADRELVKYIAGLASLFSAKVCVEGIETEGMRDILQGFHVESFQGYYYAKPLMPDKIVKWHNSIST